MKIGFLSSFALIEVAFDWFDKCCFQIIIFNVEAHVDKWVFEFGLFGLTFLFVVDIRGRLLKEHKHE